MFNNAKVGDRVWAYNRGWGTIYEVLNSRDFPIRVEFDNSSYGVYGSYQYDGKSTSLDIHPTLFWDEINFTEMRKPKVKYRMINGIKILNISFTPAPGDNYYYPYTGAAVADVRTTSFTLDCNADISRSDNNFCYPYTEEGRRVALLHAEAMLKYELVEE
jgi:hypothetical protein